MLEIDQISFAYPGQEPALKNVSLTIKEGEFIGLAGRNGSGKTTLTRVMVGLAKPAGGRVMLDGQTTKHCRPDVMAKAIGYVFQNPDRQIFRDTVALEAAFGPEQLGWSEQERQSAVQEALRLTGLEHVAQSYPRGLTRSLRQRIAIASALALRPRLLILDEPASGQDLEERRQLMELLAGLNAKGISILLVTHDMDSLLQYTARTVVLHKGEKVYDGPTVELFSDDGTSLDGWGLRAPDAAAVAAKVNLKSGPVRSIEELAAALRRNMGGVRDEKAGASE